MSNRHIKSVTNTRNVKSLKMPKKSDQTIDQQEKNFLTESEMKKFLGAARKTRHGIRDHCLMLMAFRHGLRVSELIDIRLKDFGLRLGKNLCAPS